MRWCEKKFSADCVMIRDYDLRRRLECDNITLWRLVFSDCSYMYEDLNRLQKCKYIFEFDVGLVDCGDIWLLLKDTPFSIRWIGVFLSLLIYYITSKKLIKFYVYSAFKRVNPFDPGGGHCFWGSIKPCKLNDPFGGRGKRLSNTWIIYP